MFFCGIGGYNEGLKPTKCKVFYGLSNQYLQHCGLLPQVVTDFFNTKIFLQSFFNSTFGHIIVACTDK